MAVTASLARMEATITTVDGKFGNPGRAVLGEAGFAARRTSPLASKLVRVQVKKTGTDNMLVALPSPQRRAGDGSGPSLCMPRVQVAPCR